MNSNYVEQIQICRPIKEFLELCERKGFVIIEKRVSDFHFHELYFKIEGVQSDILLSTIPKGVQKFNENKYYCNCHWTMVEIV